MLVSNKHFTPVVGLDIHIVILFGFPIPLPHPYIGFVIDPMDYVPFIGATTKINHVPRGKSDTSGIIIILFHIPMGGPFLLAPMIGHDSVNFYGSKKVKVDGTLMSPSGHMLMTCNDIGIPLSLRPGKKMKPIPSMYLPTSFSIPVSFGKPVMVGGPFVPDWAGALLNLVMSYGFGALLKGFGKALKGLNHALQRTIGANKLSKALCILGREPVDLVQGNVIYDGIDFELPGPVPLKWERSWNSNSPHDGLLGHGTHLSYDMRVYEYPAEGVVLVLLGDGRSAVFDYYAESDYNRHEKMTLTRVGNTYQLFNHSERLYYDFVRNRLETIRNESGFTIRFQYNLKGHLSQVRDTAGRILKIKNDAQGRITEVTGDDRIMVQYGYNEEGDLTTITDALGQTTHMTYQHHLMISKTDRNGQTFYWEYDKKNRCTHTWGDGGILEGWIAYHSGYNEVTDSLGKITTYYYTPDFVVTQIKDPMGYSRFTEYTDNFEVYREIDEDANVTGYTYDERGNCVSIEKPDGSNLTFNYDKDDRLILATDAQGNSRTFIYANGLLHTLTETDGSMSIFRYNADKLLCKVENERNRHTLLEYDKDFNLTAVTLADGGRSTWEYDHWGHCIRATNPLKQEQYFQYDVLGRISKVDMPDGNQIHLQYNAYEKVVQAKDRHHQVKFDYTPLGSLKMREENGAKIHFIYNKEEQVSSIVNERGERYRFARNDRGEIIEETGFDGLTRHFERDSTGRVVKVQRPGKRWTEYEYDYNGQLTRAEHSDGCWETYSYNRNGQLIEAINEHSTIQLQRDARGRVTQEWQNGHTVSSTYDNNGRRSQIFSSVGADIQVTHNEAGDVIGMESGPWNMQIQRNLLGLEIERTLPGGVKSSWTFNKAYLPESHIVSAEHGITRRRHYRWDANQRLRQIITGIGTIKFEHDVFSNLAWAQYENDVYDYRLPGKTAKYGAGEQLQETTNSRFIYDEEGNLVKKITADKIWEYEWYGNGMLSKVVRPDGRPVTFFYDALGRRIEKQYNGQVTRFLWDGKVPLHEWHYPLSQKPVTGINELGDVLQDHPEPLDSIVTWVFEEGTQVPAAKLINNKRYSIIADHAGTPCEVYDETGEKIWECELDISGKVRKLAGDKSLVPFRYQGQYEDSETGLYYNRFRYYSPDEGRYISQDPIRVEGGIKLYDYVQDPNKWIDAEGLHSTPVPYGSTDMSQMAQMYRMDNGLWTGKNVSVFEYLDDNNDLQYVINNSHGQHAERRIGGYLDEIGVHPDRVTRIYTELEPCNIPGGFCRNWIDSRYKNAAVSHSFEYGDTFASRRKGVKDLIRAARALFKCP